MITEHQPLLTAEEVAELLCLKPSTIYEAAKEGRLPCVRLWAGKRRAVVRFNPREIEELIRKRSTGGRVVVGELTDREPGS